MKIKKFNEGKHLHYTELNYYDEWFDTFLSKFFDDNDILHSELFEEDDSSDFILNVEFNCNNLTSKVLNDMSKFMKKIEEWGKYSVYTNKNDHSDWVGIQSTIYESHFPEELKLLKDTNKYNL